jgi:hypothetical protein
VPPHRINEKAWREGVWGKERPPHGAKRAPGKTTSQTMSKKMTKVDDCRRRNRLHRKGNDGIRRLIRCNWIMLKGSIGGRNG